jgi:hypothetical protein
MSRLREAMDAVRTTPKNASAWVNLGELLAADGQSEKARQSFQRALQLEPTNSTAQQGLAQILLANRGGTMTPQGNLGTGRLTPPPPSTASRTPTDPHPVMPSRDSAPQPTITRADTVSPRPNNRPVSSGTTLRPPLPPAVKPSQERFTMGLVVLVAVPLLCLCALIVAVAQLI